MRKGLREKKIAREEAVRLAEMDNRAKVVALRRQRLTFDEIATQLGITASSAHMLYHRALASHPLAHMEIDAHRIEEAELCDIATQHLMAIALSRDVSPRTRVESWGIMRGWAERKAKLFGLDAPTEIHVTTISQLDAQIAAMEAEITARVALLEGGVDAVSITALDGSRLPGGYPAGQTAALTAARSDESGPGSRRAEVDPGSIPVHRGSRENDRPDDGEDSGA